MSAIPDAVIHNPLTWMDPERGLCNCATCPLKGAPRVGSSGNPAAEVVIVGEGPGIIEIRDKKPFVGPSGDLLKSVIPKSVDLSQDVFILNSMQCFVPGGAKNPAKLMQSVKACQKRLQHLIGMYPRKVILTLGAWAASSVSGEWDIKITKRRGEVKDLILPSGPSKMIMAVHPAFLLRGAGNLKTFTMDVQRAFMLAGYKIGDTTHSGSPVIGTPRISVDQERAEVVMLDTPNKVWKFIQEFRNHPAIAMDTETEGFNQLTDEILCLGMTPIRSDGTIKPVSYIVPEDIITSNADYTHMLLSADGCGDQRRIWHNGKFDQRFWHDDSDREGLPRDTVLNEDTMLLSYALNESSKENDLENLAKDILGVSEYKDETKAYTRGGKSFRVIPLPVLYNRLANDTYYTAGIWTDLRPKVAADAALEKLYTRTLIPVSALLTDIELRGFFIDMRYVQQNDEEMRIEMAAALENLHSITGYRLNPNSPQQVADVLFNKLGLRDAKGRRPQSTDKDDLAKLNHPAAEALLEYRKLIKAHSTYVLAAMRHAAIDGKVHTTYKQHRTTTGRLASSDPNIQNIPRLARLKRMYRARPGYVIIEVDYNTAELRMLAILSEDELLTAVFLDGSRNLHDEVAIRMYGSGFTSDQRIRAKAINFGIPYGREAYSIALEFNIPVAEAQQMIDDWFEAVPQAGRFIKQCRAAPLSGQSLVTVFGRKRRPGVVCPERIDGLQNEFANFPMQSTVSDCGLHAAMRVSRILPYYDAGIVNLVHDSLVVECPDDAPTIRSVALLLKEAMEEEPKKWLTSPVTMTVDFKVARNWGMGKKLVNYTDLDEITKVVESLPR